MPIRLALFGDSRSYVSSALAEAVVHLARRRRDAVVVAICDTNPYPARSRAESAARMTAVVLAKRVFDPGRPIALHRPMFESVRDIARRYRIPLIVPPGRDVNRPEFARLITRELRADCALSLSCVQIFGPDLLAAFDRAVNYHNGLLPAYGGLRATAWSVYCGETVTGFTYHLMTQGIDEGPILLQGSVDIPRVPSVVRLEWEKTTRAASRLPEVLDGLIRGDHGSPQEGPRSYFGREALRRIKEVDDPGAISSGELRRRLSAFGLLQIRIGGQLYPVTRLRRAVIGDPLSFRTEDGALLGPDRFRYLPFGLYRVERWLRDTR